MFHCRQIDDKINKLHEGVLRIVAYNDTFTPFDDLLIKDKIYYLASKYSIISDRNI